MKTARNIPFYLWHTSLSVQEKKGDKIQVNVKIINYLTKTDDKEQYAPAWTVNTNFYIFD